MELVIIMLAWIYLIGKLLKLPLQQEIYQYFVSYIFVPSLGSESIFSCFSFSLILFSFFVYRFRAELPKVKGGNFINHNLECIITFRCRRKQQQGLGIATEIPSLSTSNHKVTCCHMTMQSHN